MPELTPDQLLESLAEALQTMAFVSIEPPPEQDVAPTDADLYRLPFSGKISGEFQMVAPRRLGQSLAANMLALDPAGEEAIQRAQDAIKELCNITAGLLLRQLCDPYADDLQMGLPQAGQLSPADWPQFVGSAVLVQAEGLPVALKMEARS